MKNFRIIPLNIFLILHIMSTSPELEAENTPDAAKPTRKKEPHALTEIVQFALIALIIVVPVRWFIAQPFIVSGASMEDTFYSGEYLIVDQLTYHIEEPEAGDVIVFRYPRNPSTFFIKRIIGTPGDTITIDGNVVTITSEEYPNGLVLDEPYIHSMTPNTFLTETLGEREYFVMGDNRNRSSDSRVWGILQRENIIGRAYVRLFPFTRIDFLPGANELTGSEIRDISSAE